MLKYKHYPIYAVYSYNNTTRMAEYRKSLAFELIKVKETNDADKIEELQFLADIAQRWDIAEDGEVHKAEIFRYEQIIKNLLLQIESSEVGKIVLDSINPQSKIFIIPRKNVVATLPQSTKLQGGGIRILFDYLNFSNKGVFPGIVNHRSIYLLHELVHASRRSNLRFDPKVMDAFSFVDEFLAVQFEVMFYLSLLKKRNKEAQKFVEENQIRLTGSNSAISVIENLLKTEPIVQKIASNKTLEYNPFRDTTYNLVRNIVSRLTSLPPAFRCCNT